MSLVVIIKNYLPEFNNKVILKNNKIKLDFSENKFSLVTNGNYSIDEGFDEYKIIFSKNRLYKYSLLKIFRCKRNATTTC